MADKIYWKARLIFAAVICAGITAALAWNRWSAERYTTYAIETHDSVSGLVADAPVEFLGVEVGNVTRMKLLDHDTVEVLLRVEKDAPVSRRTVATITSRGLTPRGFAGYVYVALEDIGSGSGPVAKTPGKALPVIPTAPFKAMTVDVTAAEAMQKIQELIRMLQPLLNQQTISSLKDTVSGMRDVTSMLLNNSDRLDALLSNAELDSREVRPLLQSSETMVRELRTGLLPQLNRTISSLDGLTRSMESIVVRLSRNPSAVIRGTTVPPGPGEH